MRSLRLPLILGLLVAAACGGGGHDPSEAPPPDMVRSDAPRNVNPALTGPERAAAAADAAAFAFDLYGQLLAQPGARGQNLACSPLSVRFAFAMAYAGARATTAEEMARALRFSLPLDRQLLALDATDLALAVRAAEALQAARSLGTSGVSTDPGDYRLRLVNQVWGDRTLPFQASYLADLATCFGTGVYVADFHGRPEDSRVAINAWVVHETLGRIQDLVPQGTIDADTRAVLVNALHFKLPWTEPFPAESTATGSFLLADGSAVGAPFMHRSMHAAYAEDGGLRMLSLPLMGNSLALLLVLPASGTALPSLGAGQAARLVQALQPELVALDLPRFRFTTASMPLKAAMQRLGMREAFTDAAQFGGISPQSLKIADAFHKAMVAVDEKGVEAAAATSVVLTPTAGPSRAVKVDRPFLFGIYDQPTATWLFLGHVVDPRS